MKRTGPTKKSTRLLSRELQKAGNERKQNIWKTVSGMLEKPRRQRPTINLEKLDRLAKRFKGKTFLVAGKVLGKGKVEEKISIAALEWSEQAKEKITAAKGSIVSIKELLDAKEKPSQIMIVK